MQILGSDHLRVPPATISIPLFCCEIDGKTTRPESATNKTFSIQFCASHPFARRQSLDLTMRHTQDSVRVQSFHAQISAWFCLYNLYT